MFLRINLSIILSFIYLTSTFSISSVYAGGCKSPYSIRINDTGFDYATITWKSNASSVSYIIKWRAEYENYLPENISPQIDSKEYTINGLSANTKYFFKIKTVCENDESKWSNEYTFITNLTNPSACGLNFNLTDASPSNKPGKTYFTIQNGEYASKRLGVNLFIQNIKLIVAHTWTSDLEINLTGPSGKKITLTSTNGLNDGKGYGNSEDSTCTETVIFSDNACNGIEENIFPFVGLYRPEEPLSNLYDSLSPIGKWQLEIIDKLKGNTGTLEYIEIDFEPIICPAPTMVSLIPLNDSSVSVSWEPNDIIDSVFIDIANTGELFKTGNSGNYILSGLENDDSLVISLRSKCNLNISASSCTKTLHLLCSTPELREGFDNYETYKSDCDGDCLQSEIWYNLTSKKWLINSGQTTTENTGPDNDVYGFGNYAYVESSLSEEDDDTIAILQTECLDIEAPYDGCSMGFYYCMYGVDIGSLSLLVSIDGGLNWDTLFNKIGNQGRGWKHKEIDLNDYGGQSCIFRFEGTTLKSRPYGDIAIDDIIIYHGSLPFPGTHLYYPDNDNDGYGKDTTGVFFCVKPQSFYSGNNLDCDDDNPEIHPDAEEILCNFIDENCNGMDDDVNPDNSIFINLSNIVDESCNGSNDGAIIIEVNGGQPPYSYLWSNNSTDENLTNVPAGKYWCEVTDESGCGIRTDTFEIKYETSISIELISLQQPSCNGIANGSISIDIQGGVKPYSFIWNNGDSLQNPINLSSGIYKVTVTDSTGCISSSPEIELKATTIFDVGIIEKVVPGCKDSGNGKISILVTGGMEPYTYRWSNGDTTYFADSLTGGEYYCTITDAELCFQVFGPVKLDEPPELNATINALDNVTCMGEENGLIEIKTVGGTPPYSFIWSNKKGDYVNFNDDIYNLKAGTYKVSIIDFKGCMKILDSIEINTLDSIELKTDSIRNVNCAGTIDGFISVSAFGGYGNYYYYWNTGDALIDHIDSLPAGLYGVTATDDLGCKQILNNIEVKNLNIPLEIDISLQDSILCYGDKSGSVVAKVYSSNSPYDFNWSAGTKIIKDNSTDTLTNLGAGKYNVTVTDNEGCVGSSNYVQLSQPSKLDITGVEVEEILCYGDNTGRIKLDISGGYPDYTVEWNDSTKTGKEIIKLTAGTYKATVYDQNNCSVITDDIILDQPDELKVTIQSNPAHENTADGSAKILVEGGVSPYFFQWDENAGNQTGNEAINLASGWYDVTLTDFNNCFKYVKVFIGEITATNENYNDFINIFPNPANDVVYISGIENIKTKIFAINTAGIEKQLRYKFFSKNKFKVNIENLETGIYIFKLISDKRIYYKKIIVLK